MHRFLDFTISFLLYFYWFGNLIYYILTIHIPLPQLLPDSPSPPYPPTQLHILCFLLKNKSSPVCVGWLLLRMGPTVDCHSIGENQFSLLYQLSCANSSLGRGETTCLLPPHEIYALCLPLLEATPDKS